MAGQVIAIDLSVSVSNLNPTISNVISSSLFQVDEDSHYICDNLDDIEVIIVANVSDANGYAQIELQGEVYMEINNGLVAFNQTMIFFKGENRTATYIGRIKVDRSYLQSPTRVKVHVYDGILTFHAPWITFDLAQQSCYAHVEHITLYETVASIDAFLVMDSMLYLKGTTVVNGSVALIKRIESPFNFSNVSARNYGYFEISVDRFIDPYLDKGELQVNYRKSDLHRIMDEDSLHPFIWNGAMWVRSSGDVDTVGEYVYLHFNRELHIGVFASEETVIKVCDEVWSCGPFGSCLGDSYQTRKCFDLNFCNTEFDKPIESKRCIYSSSPIYKLPVEERFDEPIKEPELESPRSVLFDINAEILGIDYNSEKVLLKVSLFNFGDPGLVDATVTYYLADESDNVLYRETETVPVETQVEYLKDIEIKGVPDGKYIIKLDLKYPEQLEPASTFKDLSIKRPGGSINYLIISIIFAITAMLTILIYVFWKLKNESGPDTGEQKNQ